VPALPMAADERQHALWRRYGEMVRQIARDADAGCASLDALIRECGSRAYAADGVHLTSVGYAWIAERTYEQLGGKL